MNITMNIWKIQQSQNKSKYAQQLEILISNNPSKTYSIMFLPVDITIIFLFNFTQLHSGNIFQKNLAKLSNSQFLSV